ncbi:MAG: tRNA (cytidine(34)-2'-O)-methyltransferase [Oscillospiraceae bacterium]|nr:tRNA (cytidine(34)-2'-O)-methyltransferase [Oscillospiraceae bacterium]
MLNIVLVEPEIPHNTGAVARTCAATGARLHLIRPLGFDISDKAVKRCGLDYWHLVDLTVYDNLDEYFAKNGERNLFLATTKAPRAYSEADLSAPNVTLMFGKETAGLPLWLREKYRKSCIRIPMIDEARSLNLSNSVAILAYETLRQQGFPGLQGVGGMART